MLILFDGVCNLCNGFVSFVIERDPKAHFKFGSLQSQVGQALRAKYSISSTTDSIIFIEGERFYTRSTAVLRIVRNFGGAWPVLTVFILIPRFIRDRVYDFIARNRYVWFGRKEVCLLPTTELRSRFIDD